MRQVYDLLGQPQLSSATMRWLELIAANDAGYIPAMVALGATETEIAQVRCADRKAQGVTEAEEREAISALSNARRFEDGTVVVRMRHARCATVTDRLFGTQEGEKILIFSYSEKIKRT